MTKSAWKNFILRSAESSGFLNFVQNNLQRAGQYVYILTYHRVDYLNHRPWLDPHLISATPEQFEDQMKLVATKYNPITAEDLIEAVHGKYSLPKNAVLVTVDDGYRDFKEMIFPICNRHGIKPMLFMPTAYIGTGTFWWDKVYQIVHLSGQTKIETPIGQFPLFTEREDFKVQDQLIQALKKMPHHQAMEWIESTHAAIVEFRTEHQDNTLTWEELAELDRAGITISCHTHTHPIMTQISVEEARQQVRLSQELIRQKLGHALPIFAFPDGKPHAFNSTLCEMLHTEGFEILLLLFGGQARIFPGNTKMVLPRLSVWQSQTLPQFHMRLTPLMGSGKFL
jgi:peptidoglycan/xylan/chitin deacetylase (PgdA/CDA1 family)